MMGGPASGKSTVRKQVHGDLYVVDSDGIKESHPDYDVNNPSALHAWSSRMATKEFYSMLSGSTNFVFDGTGANAEKYVTFAKAAHEEGWSVKVLYVRCDVVTALQRNAKRERTVNEDIVKEKYSTIAASHEIVAQYVDVVEVIDTGASANS